VSVSTDTALVGAYADDDGGSASGSSYVFVKARTGTNWVESAKLTASDAAVGDYFGHSVSISGDTVLMGAYGDDTHSGSAYLNRFECGFGGAIDANKWTMIGIPCDLGAENTVADVFFDDLTGAQYGYTWWVYRWNPAIDNYDWLNSGDILEQGKGYILRSDNSNNGDYWAAGSTTTTATTYTTGGLCTEPNGCFEVTLTPPDTNDVDDFRWNMVGYPGSSTVDWADVKVVIDGTAYTPSGADTDVSNTIHKWNGNAYETYDDSVGLLSYGYLKPHEAFWVKVLGPAGGASPKTVKLLIPNPGTGTVVVPVDTLTTSNPTADKSGYVNQGDNGVVMEHFQVDCGGTGDGNCDLSSITVDDLGTASSGDWDNLNIYIDTDTDFTGATLIGQTAYWGGSFDTVSLDQGTIGDRTVTHPTPKYVFIVYDISDTIAVDTTLQASVTDVGVNNPDNSVTGITYDSNVVTVIPGTVVSAGQIWMDRNLGASQVATSSTDQDAYGDLYQWGRGADGHQLRTSGTTEEISNFYEPGHSDFITPNLTNDRDWLWPHIDSLWDGEQGLNNPCPAGFRLPTYMELQTELEFWSSLDPSGAFQSTLKLPLPGYRNTNGISFQIGINGNYWSSLSIPIDPHPWAEAYQLKIFSEDANISGNYRAIGASVRCIQD
jgi:hypothetical protein